MVLGVSSAGTHFSKYRTNIAVSVLGYWQDKLRSAQIVDPHGIWGWAALALNFGFWGTSLENPTHPDWLRSLEPKRLRAQI